MTQPTSTSPTPASAPEVRAELSGAWTGRIVDEAQRIGGPMRLQWTLGPSRALNGTWSWTLSDPALSAGGSVRALDLGDPVVAVFTLSTPIRCATGETIPFFSAIVRMQEGRLVGTVGAGGTCSLRRFDLGRESP